MKKKIELIHVFFLIFTAIISFFIVDIIFAKKEYEPKLAIVTGKIYIPVHLKEENGNTILIPDEWIVKSTLGNFSCNQNIFNKVANNDKISVKGSKGYFTGFFYVDSWHKITKLEN